MFCTRSMLQPHMLIITSSCDQPSSPDSCPSSFFGAIFCPPEPTPFNKQAKQGIVSCRVKGSSHLPSVVPWEDSLNRQITFDVSDAARSLVGAGGQVRLA